MSKPNIEIPVNDDYKISIDSQNWMVIYMTTVKKKGSKHLGEPLEIIISFNMNLVNCVRSIVEDMVRKEKPDDIGRLEEMIGWYQGKQEALLETILLRKLELQDALELSKTM